MPQNQCEDRSNLNRIEKKGYDGFIGGLEGVFKEYCEIALISATQKRNSYTISCAIKKSTTERTRQIPLFFF